MTPPSAGHVEAPAPPPPPPPVRHNLPGLLVLLLAAGGLLVVAGLIFLPFVAPIVLALVAATTAYPLFEKVQKVTGTKRRGAASALTCLVLVLIVFLPLAWVGWSLAQQVRPAVEWTAQRLEKAQSVIDESWFNQQSWFQPTWQRAKRYIQSLRESELPAGPDGKPVPAAGHEAGTPGRASPAAEPKPAATPQPGAEPQQGAAPGSPPAPTRGLGDSLIRLASGAATSVISNAVEITLKSALMLFLLFFFLKDGPQILQSLKRAIPLEEKSQNRVIRTFRQTTTSIIRGSFGTAFVQGAIATVAYAIAGLPAIFWGAITTLCALIPPFGTGLITLPMIVFFLVDGQVGKAVIIGVMSLIVGLLDNVLRPWLMQGNLKVHSIWILLSVLGALKLFGPMGIIYGPMILALLGTFVTLFVEEEERAEATPCDPVPSRGAS